MNDIIAKVIVGNMLMLSRVENGHAQKDLASLLGLKNSNYLSIIEKGTNFIPLKRLWDFVEVYGLTRMEGLAALKMTNQDMWKCTMQALKSCNVTNAKISQIEDEINEIIRNQARKAGVNLIEEE